MSKLQTSCISMLFTLILLHILVSVSASQGLEATITIDAGSRLARVEGKFNPTPASKNLSFLRSAIGFPDLGSRISGLSLERSEGSPINYRRFSSTEIVADEVFSRFSYSVDLKPGQDFQSAAHTSWLTGDTGLLLIDDMLPLSGTAVPEEVILKLVPVPGWKVITSEPRDPNGRYHIKNIGRAVFTIGSALRASGNDSADVAIAGQWLFSDGEAISMTNEIFGTYEKLFGGRPAGRSSVILLKMPGDAGPPGRWEAETRGSTVVIVSADMPFRKQSLQRLHEQLRHEIFHLWLPNGVWLTGRYDWFYEGFALYQSLKTGVLSNQIRFEDMLDTLSRAYAIDRRISPRKPLVGTVSDLSATDRTSVYARGMLLAFICDLVLLDGSRGKRSAGSVLQALYRSSSTLQIPADANAAITAIFTQEKLPVPLLKDHVTGTMPIDWNSYIQLAGLEQENETSGGALRIRSKLVGRQKAVLDQLGYNSWRKLTRK